MPSVAALEAWLSAKTVLVTAIFGSIGWLFAYILNNYRDERARRLKSTIDHTSGQIREFYAPLASLTDQLWALFDVQNKVVARNPSVATRWKFYGQFLLPVHLNIMEILSSKIYYYDGHDLPESFKQYFRHCTMERAAYESFVADKPLIPLEDIDEYPPDFYDDVRVGYEKARKIYDRSVRNLTNTN